MPLTSSLVLTTVGTPVLLDAYFENLKKYDHIAQTNVFVIPDKKSSRTTFEYCEALRRKGMKIVCPGIEEQEVFLDKVAFEPSLVPYNSDNRRNVGYLMALETGSDFVISIDDDNFCEPNEDIFEEHSIVCMGAKSHEIVSTETGWFNICSLLSFDPPVATYARGFPYFARHKIESKSLAAGKAEVHINAGLWTLDPDVDAISWLVNPCKANGFLGSSVVLGREIWSPINTQNTAVRRDAILPYYFVRMGYPIAGMNIDRYGDIFSGYFAEACAKHLNGAIRVGTPVAKHVRNTHNYMNDAVNEFACIMVLEDLLPWLSTLKLSGTCYYDAYLSLGYCLEHYAEKANGKIWNDATRGYFHQMAYCMRMWANSCKTIG